MDQRYGTIMCFTVTRNMGVPLDANLSLISNIYIVTVEDSIITFSPKIFTVLFIVPISIGSFPLKDLCLHGRNIFQLHWHQTLPY